jgi:hypothetical protein
MVQAPFPVQSIHILKHPFIGLPLDCRLFGKGGFFLALYRFVAIPWDYIKEVYLLV